MKLKSILTKTIAVAALSVAGIVTINSTNSNKAQAAIVQNDAATYRVTKSTIVYNNYENGVATGQVLAANTNWKVIKTAYDNQGNKWYDLGKNQWVKLKLLLQQLLLQHLLLQLLNQTKLLLLATQLQLPVHTLQLQLVQKLVLKLGLLTKNQVVLTQQEMVNT